VFIEAEFSSEKFDFIETISYNQWVSTDRSTLMAVTLTKDVFKETFIENFAKLKAHHFISWSQAKYISDLKEKLPMAEIIILMDFAENYRFILQDASQSFHWNTTQATIHPVIVYFRKEDGSLAFKNYAVFSDEMQHDTIMVNVIQKLIIERFKTAHPDINKVHYFTDGSAAQYKNKRNFMNLSFHKEDFGLEASWNFFATAHGKGPCDGIGGTIKRLAARASLQNIYSGHILTSHQLFTWVNDHIEGIEYLASKGND
jgi:hypothetical protein